MRRLWWLVRRCWLEWRLARVMARPGAKHKIVVLPPLPPCDHLDTATIPDPLHAGQQITVCAYCGRVLEAEGLDHG